MDKVKRKTISQNLKAIMAIRDINVHELSNQSGISKYQIDNIIYNRACTEDTLERLCQFFNISKNSISSTSPIDTNYYNFNINKYNILSGYVEECTTMLNVIIDKHQMDNIINTVYKRDFLNQKEVIKGIIAYLLDQGEVSIKTSG